MSARGQKLNFTFKLIVTKLREIDVCGFMNLKEDVFSHVNFS